MRLKLLLILITFFVFNANAQQKPTASNKVQQALEAKKRTHK